MRGDGNRTGEGRTGRDGMGWNEMHFEFLLQNGRELSLWPKAVMRWGGIG